MPEPDHIPAYFETPARAERLQLLLHLVRNAGDVVYLRAPTGAGKTRFARRLLELLDDGAAQVWLRGGVDNDVAAAAVDQLGLNDGDDAGWPESVLTALSGQDLLVVVDDADRLPLPAIERLAALHAQGGRLLFIGHGGLAQTTREWDVQYVDLPPFDPDQSATFLRSNAGEDAAHINDDLAAFLHHAAHGRPGALLDSLGEVLNRARRQAEARGRRDGKGRRAPWLWIGAGVVALGVIAVLLNQDRINALFEPVAEDAPATAPSPPPMPAPVAEVRESPEQPMVPAEQPPAERIAHDDSLAAPAISLPEVHRVPEAGEIADHGAAMPEVAVVGNDSDPLEAVMRDAIDAAGAHPGVTTGAVEGVSPSPPEAAVEDVTPQPAMGAAAAPPVMAGGPVADPSAKPVNDDGPTAVAPAGTTPSAASPNNGTVTSPATARLAPEVAAPPQPTPIAAPVVTVAADEAGPAATAPGPQPAPVEDRGATAPPPPVRHPATVATEAAPVEDRSQRADDVAGDIGPAPATAVKPADTPPAAAPTAPRSTGESATTPIAESGGTAWLDSRPGAHYTLQLVAARDRAALEKFVRTHAIQPPHAIFVRTLNGAAWYSLVAGDYPDREAAVAARGRLAGKLSTKDVWPRTFASIRDSQK